MKGQFQQPHATSWWQPCDLRTPTTPTQGRRRRCRWCSGCAGPLLHRSQGRSRPQWLPSNPFVGREGHQLLSNRFETDNPAPLLKLVNILQHPCNSYLCANHGVAPKLSPCHNQHLQISRNVTKNKHRPCSHPCHMRRKHAGTCNENFTPVVM